MLIAMERFIPTNFIKTYLTMKKIVQSASMLCLFALFASCSSDDSTRPYIEPPIEGPTTPIEKHYYVSDVQSKSYTIDMEHQLNGTYEMTSTLSQQDHFVLSYTDDFKLTSLNNTVNEYKDEKVNNTYVLDYHFELDENNRLKTFDIQRQGNSLRSFVYHYKNNRLDSNRLVDEGQVINQSFTYNDKDQFIRSTITPMNLQFEYGYNDKNQLISMSFFTLSMEIGYDEGKNPFTLLPFDMTSFVFNEMDFIPLTYHFSTNFNYLKSPENEKYTIEYTYNEDHYPIKAMMYEVTEKTKNLYREIDYSYTVKEIEVK